MKLSALEQMKKALENCERNDGVSVIHVATGDLAFILSEVEYLRAKVTELQAAGSRLYLERQDIDRDRLSVAGVVREACLAAAGFESRQAIRELDLMKVTGLSDGFESQQVIRDRSVQKTNLVIAEKVRDACAAECDKEADAAAKRCVQTNGTLHWDRHSGAQDGARWCAKHVRELDLAKVIGT